MTLTERQRKFARDVGIIVIGVLLALGAEQIFRAFDNRQLAAEARATARVEISKGLADLALRKKAQPCVANRLEEISKLIATSDHKGFSAPTWIGRPAFSSFDSSGWDSATQAGRTALLSDTERAGLGAIYSALHRLDALQLQEQDVWAQLRQLEEAPQLDPLLRASVRSALQQARLLSWHINSTVVQTKGAAARLGISAEPAFEGITSSVCMPTTTPRVAAVRRMNAIWKDDLGEP